ncbi:CHAP domain-containing protein [Thermomonospora umbrina]|uniref:CHAP domain-containing protein n=1 Tax=Thermomonospora umbrina TaxID=111806 RepID=A0A3D9T0J1_9ACTN|nr:CHAP domain-containing protein [Thermomonospora umbrina]REE99843.1 CHAP domain-containing protein [Thermomonospora umbrina]
MDPIGKKLLDVAKDELGYREKSDGYTKYGDWYGENVDQDSYFKTAPWCDMFLAWAADKAGVTEWAGQFAYTPFHAQWFKKEDAWGTDPEPGAIVFFAWSGSKSLDDIQHVGIVERADGDTVHTIEANADGVHLKRKERSTDSIVGYGYPAQVKVAGRSVESVVSGGGTPRTEKEYAPKHAAPAPPAGRLDAIHGDLTAAATAAGTVGARERDDSADRSGPALGELLAVAIVGSLALALGKTAVGRLPASSPVRIRKRGRHHRAPVALPADVTPATLEAADAVTMAMPILSAQVAAEAEDREFWSQISHLEKDDLAYWGSIAEPERQAAGP